MGLNFTIKDRGIDAPRNGAQSTVAIVGVCSGGVAATCYQFSKDGDIGATLGDGPLVEEGGLVIRTAKVPQLLCKVAGSIAGALSAVAQTGTGPLPTLAGPPYDSLTPKLKITSGGALGAAKFKVALDGATYGAELDVPSKQPAAQQGTIDLSAAGALTSIDTKTFIVTTDLAGPITTTFAGVTTPADVIDQINADLGVDGVAELISGRYLKVKSATDGATSSLAIGAGTANAQLGFTTAATADGADAVYEIPNTGVTVTFIAGTYVADEVYSWTQTAPRFTTTDLAAALAALRNFGVPFESVILCYEPIDGADLLVMASAFDSIVAGWWGSTPKLFVAWAMSGPLSATPGSSASDQTNDTDVKTALANFTAAGIGAIAQGDCYVPGTNLAGLFRRPLGWALAARMAAYRLSSDVGNGEQPALEFVSVVGPDGVTKARDEDSALVPMKPQRFVTMHAQNGGAYFVRGVSRAASSSKFRHFGVGRMAMLAARTAYAAALPYNNADRDLNADGTLREDEAATIEQAITQAMKSALVDSPAPGESHASAVVVAVDRTEIVGETDDVTFDFSVQHKGQFETVTANLGIVSVLSFT